MTSGTATLCGGPQHNATIGQDTAKAAGQPSRRSEADSYFSTAASAWPWHARPLQQALALLRPDEALLLPARPTHRPQWHRPAARAAVDAGEFSRRRLCRQDNHLRLDRRARVEV